MAKCTAKSKRSKEPCRNNAVNGYSVCRMHGAGGGAPKGSQNHRLHGLYAKALATPEGEAVYHEALKLQGDQAAKETAAFLMAQIHEAYTVPAKLGKAGELIEAFLMQQVEAEQISYEAAQAMLAKIRTPHVTQLAKAVAPLKGLLEKADGVDDEVKRAAIAIKREQLEIDRQKAGTDDDGEEKLPAIIPAHSEDWQSLVGGAGIEDLDPE